MLESARSSSKAMYRLRLGKTRQATPDFVQFRMLIDEYSSPVCKKQMRKKKVVVMVVLLVEDKPGRVDITKGRSSKAH